MFGDEDIKIFEVGSKDTGEQASGKPDKTLISAAKKLGRTIAAEFIEAVSQPIDDESDSEMLLQRQFLLSFTVTVSLETYCDDYIAGIAQKQFLDYLRNKSLVIYKNSSDTGAFTFYYLAFRRGSEVERRIGQTFAMLCSHDGDPIYQELGEALYCWFSSVVKRKALAEGLLK